MDINLLVNVTSKAWALPILAALDTGTPGRQAALMAATGAGRTAFAQSLAHLLALGLVIRNPGHGHPLRPEYALSQAGLPVAAAAGRITQSIPDTGDPTLLRKTWTVPILALATQPRSFTGIKHRLSPVTDRALSLSLKQLQQADWVHREIDPALHPPRATYSGQGTGLIIGRAVWG